MIYDRDGAAKHGVVILRNQDDDRTLARIPASDKQTLARLLDLDRSAGWRNGCDQQGGRRHAGMEGGLDFARIFRGASEC